MENENTKKRKGAKVAIILAMVLLICALLGFGGRTFAKYITSKDVEAKDVKVAKWGITITVTDNLFSEQYKDASKVAAGTDGIDVQGATKVVAPGTGGSMTIAIAGNAEVLAQLKITADPDNTSPVFLNKTKGGTEEYRPIKWTLQRGTDAANKIEGTLDEVLEALATDATNSVIEIGSTINETYTLSWAWALENDNGETTEAAKAAAIAQNDEYDTVLALLANGATPATDWAATDNPYHAYADYEATDYNVDLKFKLNITVAQIQNQNRPA